MALYRILILGRTKANEAALEQAVANIPGLTSVSIAPSDIVITVDSDDGPDAVMALVGAAVEPFGCFVQLLGVIAAPKHPINHRFLIFHECEAGDDTRICDAWKEALQDEFGDAFELAWAHIGVDHGAAMSLSLHSYLSQEQVQSRVAKIARGLPIKPLSIQLMRESTPPALVPKPRQKSRSTMRK